MNLPELARSTRRRIAVAVAAGLLTGSALAARPVEAQAFPELALELVAGELPGPTDITHAGDARLFVVLQRGDIRIVRNGSVDPQPFLDLRDRVSSVGEQGLLALAFHPAYATNGWFFVNYIDESGDTVISRFLVSSDPDRADPESEAVLLNIDQPFSNHNGGQLAFGPDGMLYVATGDGGNNNDPLCNAQDRSNLLGKILRLDVDSNATVAPYHVIPADNPFVTEPVSRSEIWAYGLRNPWRFSFDRATGDLYVADVGQDRIEEVSFVPAGSPAGANFGWKVMEGEICTGDSAGCAGPLPACSSESLVRPILTYPTAGDCAVTGGYVYRGPAIGGLTGDYLFGDFCSGRLWTARRNAEGAWVRHELPLSAPSLRTFGEDVLGEIYLGAGDELLKLVAANDDPGPPELCVEDDHTLCLGAGGRFAVEASFRAGGGDPLPAAVRPITADTGALWFFDEANLELIVKVLDACTPFGRFWVFAAGLTDVEVELVVTDTEEGVERRYANPAGTAFRPVQDTDAFASCP